MAQDFSPNEAEPAKPAAEDVTGVIPDDIAALFGEPPLYHWENPDDYNRLLEYIAAEVKPKGTMEWLYTKDIADLTWEGLRLRRIKAACINSGTPRASRAILGPIAGIAEAFCKLNEGNCIEDLVRNSLGGDEKASKTVDALLHGGGLERDALTAASFCEQIKIIENIERMQSGVDRRRDQLLHEIERRRFALSQQLREASRNAVTDLDPDAVVR